MRRRVGELSARFTFSGSFQRSYGPFHGSAPDGRLAEGDQVVLSGSAAILFHDGTPGGSEQVTLTVTHVDFQSDLFHGVFVAERAYPAPSLHGEPWPARVEGCCRLPLAAGSPSDAFALRAGVDLAWHIAGAPANSSGVLAAPAHYRALPGPRAAAVFVDHADAAHLTLCQMPDAVPPAPRPPRPAAAEAAPELGTFTAARTKPWKQMAPPRQAQPLRCAAR